MPDVAYSGFDGSSTFKVPIYTTLENATFEVDDPTVADIQPAQPSQELQDQLGSFAKTWAMITTRQPGTTTVFASAGSVRVQGSLEVTAYDPADMAIGDQRYNNPANPDTTSRIPCKDCHGGPDGVDHTPLALAYYTDDEIIAIVTQATYPDGGMVNDGSHTWNLTDAEAAGIVPYLRALQPRGF